jgi:hypothetical protein
VKLKMKPTLSQVSLLKYSLKKMKRFMMSNYLFITI